MVTLELNSAQDRSDFVVELLSLESTLGLSWQICQAEKFFRNPDLVRMLHRHLDCKFPGGPNVELLLSGKNKLVSWLWQGTNYSDSVS